MPAPNSGHGSSGALRSLSGAHDLPVVLAIGLVLAIVGLVLLLNLGGAGAFVIRRVTSRNLGELAPGYAASAPGFRVYAILILSIGLAVAGLGALPSAAVAGAIVFGGGLLAFVIASVIAIVGEVRTYRSLPGRDQRR